MRIGIVSPYSLTLPGGVQGQILALARVLRQKGHETRVLGPCDGPPPDAGVTPLGNSLPTSANGSMAPIAPDIPAQIRLLRALRDEAFDVVLSGGVMHAVPRLAAEVEAHVTQLAPRCRVQRLQREPAHGAVALAVAEANGGARIPKYANP